MAGLGLDNSISNIIGKKLPQWVLNQLETRANQNSKDSRDTDNILYLANKTAWVRLVSSINIESQYDLNHFKGIVGETTIKNPDDLAKQFVLFGGTSKYLGSNSYGLRSGLGNDGAYGMLGTKEIQEYGYRPMPGITSVNIETQGRLGSVRGAIINFKCWDKNQLDIIDTLYFKLGFTMFLEWGHTFFYPSPASAIYRKEYLDPNKLQATELYSIDPFRQDLTKEEIAIEIAKNSRETEGNYDAMLGMVTNFNFSYNAEGGFDCTVRLMALGVLGDSIKINNSGILPGLLEEEILRYNKTLTDITRAIEAKNALLNNPPTTTTEIPKINALKADDFFNTYIKPTTDPALNANKSTAVATGAPGGGYALSNTGVRTGLNSRYNGGSISLNALDQESYKTIDATFNTERYGYVYFIRRQKGFIPLREDLLRSVKVTLDGARILKNINNSPSVNGIKGYATDQSWKFPNNYLDKAKLVLSKTATSVIKFFSSFTTQNIISYFATSQLESSIKTGTSELDKIGDSAVYESTYKLVSGGSGQIYNIKVERRLWAVSDRTDIIGSNGAAGSEITYTNSAFAYISTEEFVSKFQLALLSSDTTFNVVSISNGNDKTTTLLSIKIPFIQESAILVKGGEAREEPQPDGSVKKIPAGKPEIKKENVTYQLDVELSIDDSSLISGIIVSDPSITEPVDFVAQKKLVEQNQTQIATGGPDTSKEDAKKAAEYTKEQVKQAISYQSSLEIALRTIQVHALNQAIDTNNKDLEIGRKVYNLKLLDTNQRSFTNQIFSNGIFTPFLDDLLSDKSKINDDNYSKKNGTEKISLDERLKVYSKYGFATSLLANKATIDTLEPTNYQQLLNAYVIPYQVNQELVKGISTNHPVYIPLGLLLMILNHSCTIYDTKGKKPDLQTPLVYVDFNTELNFFLSNTKQLSTNPWVTLIPFEGTDTDYISLFDPTILQNQKTQIQPVSGSSESSTLFKPQSEDLLSGNLPKIKFDDSISNNIAPTSNAYRGKLMNILLNIDYLVKLVEEYSLKNGSNSVYLKTFLEQILSDLNKYLGNFNKFRLAYNDAANTFQIVDDQFLPALDREDQISPDNRGSNSFNINQNGLPLYGKRSIAKSLEIKTEISSKLSNMIAISANSNSSNKATLSTNGDPVGFINTSYVDRYVQDRTEITGSNKNNINFDTIKTAAAEFNKTIVSFYSKINPSENSVGQATNYYIDKMSKIKNDDYATRASPMIPVSVNFSTDGISGMSMGHAFTIPDELLPYTYSSRNSQQTLGTKTDFMNKVGFVMIGLTHRIENNTWNTDVKANMIFLKDKNTDFTGDVQKLSQKDQAFGGPPDNFHSIASDAEPGYAGPFGAGGGDCGCSRCPPGAGPQTWNATKQRWDREYSCADQVVAPASVNSGNFGNDRQYYGSYKFVKGTSDINLSKIGLTPLSESEIVDDTTQNRFLIGTIVTNPDSRNFVVHHTAGNPGPAGRVYNTFYARGLPAQYVIDGNANIHRFMPDGAKGWHASEYNGRSIGVEISARNNDNVSDAQAKAAVRLIHYLGFKKSQVVGHGEISQYKEKTEGKKVVDIIRRL